MGTDSGVYKLVFLLHLIAVIVGFGTVFLNGVYGSIAKRRRGAEGLAVAEANYDVSVKWAEPFIYAVPVLGILLVLLSDDQFKFSQAWVSLSFLLYIVSIGVVHALHLPNLRRMNALMAGLVSSGPAPGSGLPPEVTELEAREKRAAAIGTALNLVLVVLVALMIWKPGY